MHMQVSQLLAEHPCLVSRGITVYAACPGSCATDMNPHGRHTTAAGAATPAWLVTHEQPEQLSGRFWMWRQQMSFWVFFAILYDSVYVVGETCRFGSRNPITINGRCNTCCK